jgi:hypothetical protein
VKHKFIILLAALVVGLLGFTARARADMQLLSANENNTLKFANVENLYDASGKYVSGNNAPIKGDYLVAIFNITENTTNGWASIPLAIPGVRDTYTGISVAKITAVTVSGGVTTISLTAPSTGDVTKFVGGAHADASTIDTTTSLNYANNDTVAIFHQGGTAATSVLPVLSFNGKVGTDASTAVEGSKYLVLNNHATNSYMFSTGTVPPPASALGLTSFEGLGIDFNGTGFANFQQIGDPNVNHGANTVPFYIESKINLNANGQFASPPGSQNWDFQSSDPANLLPTTVPEPASLGLLAIGATSILSGAWIRRRREARRAG